MDDYTRAVAAILKKAQQASGKSYTQVAAETGLSRPTVERVLNGKRDVTVRYLRALSALFGLVPAEVVNDAEKASI